MLFYGNALPSFNSELKHQGSLTPVGYSFPTSGGAEQWKKKKKHNKLPPRLWPDPINWKSNLYTTDIWLLGANKFFRGQKSQSSSETEMEDDIATCWLNIRGKKNAP